MCPSSRRVKPMCPVCGARGSVTVSCTGCSACSPARKWARKYTHRKDVWEKCQNPDWLVWWIRRSPTTPPLEGRKFFHSAVRLLEEAVSKIDDGGILSSTLATIDLCTRFIEDDAVGVEELYDLKRYLNQEKSYAFDYGNRWWRFYSLLIRLIYVSIALVNSAYNGETEDDYLHMIGRFSDFLSGKKLCNALRGLYKMPKLWS